LQVTGCWLPNIGYKLPVASYQFLKRIDKIANHYTLINWLSVTCNWKLVTRNKKR